MPSVYTYGAACDDNQPQSEHSSKSERPDHPPSHPKQT